MRSVRLKDHSRLNISMIGAGIEGTASGSFALKGNMTFNQDVGPSINDVGFVTDPPLGAELNKREVPNFINTPPTIEEEKEDLNDKDKILADIQKALNDMKSGKTD